MQPRPLDPATEDSVSFPDWDKVHHLAVEIVHASAADDARRTSRARRSMHALLRKLLGKYGDLPSLLGAKGDYTQSLPKRILLYKRACALAVKRKLAYNAFQRAIDLALCEQERGATKAVVSHWLRLAASIPRPVGDPCFDGELERACSETGVQIPCNVPARWKPGPKS